MAVEEGQREAGFGILEAIIALAIASLALAALYRMEGGALRATAKVRAHELALQHARAHLDALGGDGTLLSGDSAGTYAGGLVWRLNVVPLTRPAASDIADKPYWIRLEALDGSARPILLLETAKLAREAR